MAVDTNDLDLTPTPDNGDRLSAERLLDEDNRPVRAPLGARAAYTPGGRAFAQLLLTAHDELRNDLAMVRRALDRLANGSGAYSDARAVLNKVITRQQQWALGAECSSYCTLLTQHHFGEDFEVFPVLRGKEPTLDSVLDRLTVEHDVIHHVVERIDQELIEVVSGTSTIASLQVTADLLTDTLLSHLAYEESQLLEPMALYLG